MKKRWIALFAVLLIAGIGAFAGSRAYFSACNCSSDQGVGTLQAYLELSDEQRQKIADIDADFAKKRPLLREQVWQTRDKLTAVIRDPKATREEIVSTAEKLGDAQKALQVNTMEYIYELSQHLNKEQRAKLVDVLDKGMCSAIGGKPENSIGGCSGCTAPKH